MAAAVLITVSNGTVDYCTEGKVNVVLIDLDRYNPDTAFPDDITSDINRLLKLPDMPWVYPLIRQLDALRSQIDKHLNEGTE